MAIVTDLDRKQTREMYLWLAGALFFAIASALWFYWTRSNRDSIVFDTVVFIVLLLLFVFCGWRFETMASCSAYCPDEPALKD